MNKNVLYRSIPKVDILLADEGIKVLIEAYSRESVMEAIHSEMEKLRAYIGTCNDEEKAKQIMSEEAVEILIQCGDGSSSGVAWGCDLTYDYVKINADYRS